MTKAKKKVTVKKATKKKAINMKIVRKKKIAKLKAAMKKAKKKEKNAEKEVEKKKGPRGYKNKVLRKWLYQCAYWRFCESCSLRIECLQEMKDNGIEKPWLEDQIKGIKRFK